MPNTPARGGAQERRASKRRNSTVPSPSDANALAINDGVIFCGTVVESDGAWFAFTPDAKLWGTYSTKLEAVRSLPYVDRVGGLV